MDNLHSNTLYNRYSIDFDLLGIIEKGPAFMPPQIVRGLIAEGANTLVLVPPGADARMFAAAIAYACASGDDLPPFRTVAPVATCLAARVRNPVRLRQLLKQVAGRSLPPEQLDLARKNLLVISHPLDSQDFLNWVPRPDQLLEHAPFGWRLAVIYDEARVSPARDTAKVDRDHAASLLRDFNNQDVATVVFVQASTSVREALEGDLFSGFVDQVVELAIHPFTPTESGGGFAVHREKFDEHDLVPCHFFWWWRIIDGEVEFGWEIPDPGDTTTEKRLEMAERQLTVKKLAEAGLQNKLIASTLGISESMVSRDLAKAKATARRSAKVAANSSASDRDENRLKRPDPPGWPREVRD